MSLVSSIKKIIQQAFPDSQIEITDTQGNGYHLEIQVISPVFSGKTRVIQHQMVYKVLKDHIDDGTLHAVTVKTKEPQK
jgi:stress-induced morphogen